MKHDLRYWCIGPWWADAVQLFVTSLQQWLQDVHTHTEHLLHSLQVHSLACFPYQHDMLKCQLLAYAGDQDLLLAVI